MRVHGNLRVSARRIGSGIKIFAILVAWHLRHAVSLQENFHYTHATREQDTLVFEELLVHSGSFRAYRRD